MEGGKTELCAGSLEKMNICGVACRETYSCLKQGVLGLLLERSYVLLLSLDGCGSQTFWNYASLLLVKL